MRLKMYKNFDKIKKICFQESLEKLRTKLLKSEDDCQLLKDHLVGLQAQNESMREQLLDAERKLAMTAGQIMQKDGKNVSNPFAILHHALAFKIYMFWPLKYFLCFGLQNRSKI